MLIDTHCHLDFPEFDSDREDVIRRCRENGIEALINIGSSVEGSRRSVELAGKHDAIYATVGIHPHEADGFDDKAFSAIKDFAGQPKVVAIGEIGLDYYKNYSSKSNQRKMFIALVRLAKDLDLPLVIHNRQAPDEVLGVLKEEAPLRGVVHCFSEDKNFLQECLNIGFYISFTCNITYKKADNLRELVRQVPLERLLLETDAPFLPPQEFRGRRNEPLHVRELARKISDLRNIAPEEVAAVTTGNARKLFNLK
jgi:TatD DNase family protein